MQETIRQTILYLRDVLKLSFYQIQDRTGISRKRASRIYRGSSPGEREERGFVLTPHLGTPYGFVFILSYSRYLFAQVFARSSFEFFIEGHRMAFAALEGLPYGIRYDNLATV